ncbi:MAG: T9SS type A sorting domain-containing protein [Salinivirgaceae bacterium]|jgi:hypothetical protein|nr:T9SS type A sorting domain-containing protein [Salinivirgaceae bacterium]
MKRKLFVAAILMVSVPALAQVKQSEVVSAAGGYVEKDNVSVSYTIGEPVAGTVVKDGLIVVHGFQQGYVATAEVNPGINQLEAVDVKVYPNPVNTVMYVELSNIEAAGCIVKCFDMAGQLIKESEFGDDSRLSVDMSDLPQGAYFVRVESEDGAVVNKKIMKY